MHVDYNRRRLVASLASGWRYCLFSLVTESLELRSLRKSREDKYASRHCRRSTEEPTLGKASGLRGARAVAHFSFRVSPEHPNRSDCYASEKRYNQSCVPGHDSAAVAQSGIDSRS